MTAATYSRHVYDAMECLRKAKAISAAVDEPNAANVARLRAAIEQTKSALTCLEEAHEILENKIN